MLPFFVKVNGAIAKRLCTGLQIRVGRFDSGPRLQTKKHPRFKTLGAFFMPEAVKLQASLIT